MRLNKLSLRVAIGAAVLLINWLGKPQRVEAVNCGGGGVGCGNCIYHDQIFTCCSPFFNPHWTWCAVPDPDGACDLGELCS